MLTRPKCCEDILNQFQESELRLQVSSNFKRHCRLLEQMIVARGDWVVDAVVLDVCTGQSDKILKIRAFCSLSKPPANVQRGQLPSAIRMSFLWSVFKEALAFRTFSTR